MSNETWTSEQFRDQETIPYRGPETSVRIQTLEAQVARHESEIQQLYIVINGIAERWGELK